MIYPKNFEQKIGFDQIRLMLRDACAGPLGLAYVDRMRFTDHLPTLEKLLHQTDEFRRIVEGAKRFRRAILWTSPRCYAMRKLKIRCWTRSSSST